MSKKNDASGSSALRRSTSSLRPKRRIVTWKGSGVPSGGARSAIASPSRIVSRRGSRRVASTTSGTATVTSFSWREKTRTSSPALCTWIRAPSSLYSNAASPSSVRASATSAAAWASIGWIGRNSSIRKRASPAAPSTSAARATAARSPASIAARRTKSGSSPAARATASVTSPSSAPCRSSPISSRNRNSCSSWVARANSSRSRRSFAWAEPLPVVWARRSSSTSTWTTSRVGASAARSTRAAWRAAYPMPIRPCRGAPERKAIAVSISPGAACFSEVASRSIFASRPLVWATRREVWPRSSRRTGERCTPPLRTASAGWEPPPRDPDPLGERAVERPLRVQPLADAEPVVEARVHRADQVPGQVVDLAPVRPPRQRVERLLIRAQQLEPPLRAAHHDQLEHRRVAPLHHGEKRVRRLHEPHGDRRGLVHLAYPPVLLGDRHDQLHGLGRPVPRHRDLHRVGRELVRGADVQDLVAHVRVLVVHQPLERHPIDELGRELRQPVEQQVHDLGRDRERREDLRQGMPLELVLGLPDRLGGLVTGGDEALVRAVDLVGVAEELVVPVVAQHVARAEIGPHLPPAAEHAHFFEPILLLDGERRGVDHAHAPHPDDGGAEPVVVLHQPALGVALHEGRRVGRAVAALDAVHRAAPRHDVERADLLGQRTEPDPRAVGGGGDDPGHGLPVVPAHVREREPVGVEVDVQLAQPDARLGADEAGSIHARAEQLRLEIEDPAQAGGVDQKARREGHVGPRVPGPDRAYGAARSLGLAHERDDVVERLRGVQPQRLDRLIAEVVLPGLAVLDVHAAMQWRQA